MQVGEGQQVQIVQAQPQGQAQQAQSGTGQTMQVMQQIITNTGEIQQIPVSPALPTRAGHCAPVVTGVLTGLTCTHSMLRLPACVHVCVRVCVHTLL